VRKTTTRLVLPVLAAMAFVCPAHAEPSPSERALAQTLFREGRQLITTGNAAEACTKFSESDRLDPEIGTHLNLAFCHETLGKTASAWVEFGEVADRAERIGDRDRAAFARQRVAALDKRLSRVRFRTILAAPGMTLKVDGHVLNPAVSGEPLPLDPGTHTVEASAPGKQAWARELAVPPGPSAQELDVTPLADAPVSPSPEPATTAAVSAPPPPAEVTSSGDGSLRTVSYFVAGAGVVGIGLGTYFGLAARSKNDESFAGGNCDTAGCNATGKQARNDALADATVSTVAFVAGGAALVGGVVLFLVSSKKESARAMHVEAAPMVGARTGGMAIRGTF
jgi:hypothetical protein